MQAQRLQIRGLQGFKPLFCQFATGSAAQPTEKTTLGTAVNTTLNIGNADRTPRHADSSVLDAFQWDRVATYPSPPHPYVCLQCALGGLVPPPAVFQRTMCVLLGVVVVTTTCKHTCLMC